MDDCQASQETTNEPTQLELLDSLAWNNPLATSAQWTDSRLRLVGDDVLKPHQN